jgi:threonine synthase
VSLTAQAAAQGIIEPGQRVVVISTAHGLKFSEFKVSYHEGSSLTSIHDTATRPWNYQPMLQL